MQVSADPTTRALSRARRRLDTDYAGGVDVRSLAQAVGLSPFHFIRAFRAAYGCTPYQYLTHRRIDAARRLLREDALSVTEIAFEVGFESPAAFSARFRQAVGEAPQRYRRQVFQGIYVPRRFVPQCFLQGFAAPPRLPRAAQF